MQSAYYHSGGWRINPNLYEEGKVCLSLLNTWTGKGNEVWDPKSSSILQVLVSLQGLVLNSRPYFNEAGYDKQVGTAEGEKNSLSYNENTFLLNCKTMMYLIRKPPKVIDHMSIFCFTFLQFELSSFLLIITGICYLPIILSTKFHLHLPFESHFTLVTFVLYFESRGWRSNLIQILSMIFLGNPQEEHHLASIFSSFCSLAKHGGGFHFT